MNRNANKEETKVSEVDLERGIIEDAYLMQLPLVAIVDILGHFNYVVHVAAVGGRHFSIASSNI